jgi:hypothetical protein
MKISELIYELNKCKEQIGDVDVIHSYNDILLVDIDNEDKVIVLKGIEKDD